MIQVSPQELASMDPAAFGTVSSDLWADCTLHITEAADCLLPKRNSFTHKYSYGRALIIAGCRGFSGAPCLAANACERSGAGLTMLMVPESIYDIAAIKTDGAVVLPLPCHKDGGLSAEGIDTILNRLKQASVCLIGPGLGQSEDIDSIVEAIMLNAACPLILDADGINALSRHIDLLDKTNAPVILTPHEGEFARISTRLQLGRLPAAHSFAKKHSCTLVLKGHRTVVTDGGSDAFINVTGGPALAKGGSGDVLAGILAALLAQGFPPFFSAKAAAYLHGLAGDIAAEHTGEYCLAPNDIICALPAAFKTVTEG